MRGGAVTSAEAEAVRGAPSIGRRPSTTADRRNVAALTSRRSEEEITTSRPTPRPGPIMAAADQLATRAAMARSVWGPARPGSADFAAG